MIQLLNPAWLWGLTALLLPIAIHLLNRKEGKVIPFGSLRFLQESKTSRFRSLALNEVALLLLRCLLIVLLVLYLAGFTWYKSEKPSAIYIENGLDSVREVATIRDSLLSKNFMLVNLPEGQSRNMEFRALAESLASQYRQVVMVTSQLAKNLSGERTVKPQNLTWIPVSLADDVEFDLFRLYQDASQVRVGKSNEATTEYRYKNAVRSSNNAFPTRIISIHASPGFETDTRVLTSALEAISTVTPYPIQVRSDQETTAKGWHVFLGQTPGNADSVIIYKALRNGNSAGLFRRDTAMWQKQRWILSERLTPISALEHDLIQGLVSILFPDHNAIPPEDRRVLPDRFVWNNAVATAPMPGSVDTLHNPWLMLIFLLVLVSERLLSKKRKQ